MPPEMGGGPPDLRLYISMSLINWADFMVRADPTGLIIQAGGSGRAIRVCTGNPTGSGAGEGGRPCAGGYWRGTLPKWRPMPS
ncbi:protein of unknown function [Candidatus Hydrogenisulfobacillus filiaventi]|uniref:Uncharacterized protein n=1 Tax=Candidatus Hydrogenisulfobacillus filiaventi TaxID=2707344 RepID=A0A6F8ZKB1_9FIRM|nr:protein of unknown function [Candidatus Hydrogenisulfobacillus filiaventi]